MTLPADFWDLVHVTDTESYSPARESPLCLLDSIKTKNTPLLSKNLKDLLWHADLWALVTCPLCIRSANSRTALARMAIEKRWNSESGKSPKLVSKV